MTLEEFERQYLCGLPRDKRVLYIVPDSIRRREIMKCFDGQRYLDDIFIKGDRITFITANELYRIRGCEFDEVIIEEEARLSKEDLKEIRTKTRDTK